MSGREAGATHCLLSYPLACPHAASPTVAPLLQPPAHVPLVHLRCAHAEPRQQQQQQPKRRPDPRTRQSEFTGLLGGGGGGGGRDKEKGDSGLLDVWFERKGPSKGGSGSSGKDKGKDKRRR